MDSTVDLSRYAGVDYLRDPIIPLYPPIVMNPALMELSRMKAMELCRLAESGVDVETEYPDAYRAMLEDLGDMAVDFDAYISHVQGVLTELAELVRVSGGRALERHEYTPFYGRAKFRSALTVFAKDPEKYEIVTILISQYKDMMRQAPQVRRVDADDEGEDFEMN